MPNPTFDRDSEKRQEAHDRAKKRLSSGEFDIGDFRDAFFNLPKKHWEELRSDIMNHEHADIGAIVIAVLFSHLREQEHED